jgi:hypothetical protein
MGERPGRASTQGDARSWCCSHIQAIIVAIDHYAETALGNREFFLNKPYRIVGSRTKQAS